MVRRGMATLGAAEAERLLADSSAGLPPITLAAGDEDFLRDRLVAAFRAGAAAEGSEFLRMEGDEASAEDLANGFAALSLFGTGRRIWIREGAKLGKGCEETILAWVEGSGEGVRLLITTARGVEELKLLQSLAAGGTVVSCAAGRTERLSWARRLAAEAGLKLPGGALEAIAERSTNLLALRQEIEKLRLHADDQGRVPPEAMASLGGERGGASSDRWAEAVLAGDRPRARAEAASLDAEGTAGTAALWAIAGRALAALDPQPYGPYRRGSGSGAPLSPGNARRILDAVYQADRALKRGEIRDAEIRDYVEQTIGSASGHES